MFVAILGPGGVGGLLGGLLARDGVRVVLVGRAATVDSLRASGLTVRSERYGTFTAPVEAATHLPEGADAVLVTVKATGLAEAVEAAPQAAVADALVVPFLNGIDHVAALRARYGAAAVAPATIRIEVMRLAGGEIVHTSPFAAIDIASDAATSSRAEPVAGALRHAGLEVSVRTDEVAMLWEKIAMLAPLALMTTYAMAPVGTVRTQRRDEMLACIREVSAVAGAQGAGVDADRAIALLDVIPETMSTSMHRDAVAGQPLELDAIGGAVLRAAEAARIPVPVTGRIVAALRTRAAAGGAP